MSGNGEAVFDEVTTGAFSAGSTTAPTSIEWSMGGLEEALDHGKRSEIGS
jgi:hypothetical protein